MEPALSLVWALNEPRVSIDTVSDMANFQEKRKFQAFNRKLTEADNVSGISPSLVYNITLSGSAKGSSGSGGAQQGSAREVCSMEKSVVGGSGTCWLSTSLQWFGKQPCSVRTICTRLRGNICGDYGLVVNHVSGSNGTLIKSTNLCFENQLVEYSANSGEIVDIRLWYLVKPGPNDVNCFSWCNLGGSLPTLPEVDYSSRLITFEVISRSTFSIHSLKKIFNFF